MFTSEHPQTWIKELQFNATEKTDQMSLDRLTTEINNIFLGLEGVQNVNTTLTTSEQGAQISVALEIGATSEETALQRAMDLYKKMSKKLPKISGANTLAFAQSPLRRQDLEAMSEQVSIHNLLPLLAKYSQQDAQEKKIAARNYDVTIPENLERKGLIDSMDNLDQTLVKTLLSYSTYESLGDLKASLATRIGIGDESLKILWLAVHELVSIRR